MKFRKIMEDLKTEKYSDIYNHLCSAQFIADEIGDDLADEILRIREKIGKKILNIGHGTVH